MYKILPNSRRFGIVLRKSPPIKIIIPRMRKYNLPETECFSYDLDKEYYKFYPTPRYESFKRSFSIIRDSIWTK